MFLGISSAQLFIPVFASNVLSLREFIELSLREHKTLKEYESLRQSETLNLKNGERYYWPDVIVQSSYDEVMQETDPTSLSTGSRTIESGVTTGVDTTWTSIIGTELTLGLEHQYGRQLGKTNQGIPEKDLQANSISVEVSQPLLSKNSPQFNQLDLNQARNQWEDYLLEGDVNRLSITRDALLSFVSVQEQYDLLNLQFNKLEYARYLLTLTEARVREGRSTAIDEELAKLDVAVEEQSSETTKLRLEQTQQQAVLSLIDTSSIRLQPLISLTELINLFSPALVHDKPLRNHPEYLQQSKSLNSAKLQEFATRRHRWPDLSAYYRYEKTFREELADEETQAWGIRFSYSLFDIPAAQQQARLRAEVSIAQWNLTDRLAQLTWEAEQLRQTSTSLLSQLKLNEQSLRLAEKALDNELIRYKEGVASYSEVQRRQQDMTDRKLSAIANEVELANSLINLAYYTQLEWLSVLP